MPELLSQIDVESASEEDEKAGPFEELVKSIRIEEKKEEEERVSEAARYTRLSLNSLGHSYVLQEEKKLEEVVCTACQLELGRKMLSRISEESQEYMCQTHDCRVAAAKKYSPSKVPEESKV